MTGTEGAELDGHPIRFVIAGVLKDGVGKEEPAVLDDRGTDAITKELDKTIGSEELVDAVEMILGIAYTLETQQKSPGTAQKLIDIVEREKVLGALKDLNRKKAAQRAEEVAKTANKFTGFTGGDPQKKAPRPDEAAPKGSIKLGSLTFPKKL
jgi:hypothetical protein